jgi:hypothetical protein
MNVQTDLDIHTLEIIALYSEKRSILQIAQLLKLSVQFVSKTLTESGLLKPVINQQEKNTKVAERNWEIRELAKLGANDTELAKEFDLPVSMIRFIKTEQKTRAVIKQPL